MIFRTEKDDDKAQVKALWKLCFDDTDKFTDWFFSERWKPEYGVVAEENGKITAAMQGWHYALSIRGKKLPAVMLAGVCTHPDYRGRGLMPQCLSLFMQNARDRGELIVFHTPARHPTFFKCLHYSASDTAFVKYEADVAGECRAKIEDASDAFAEKLIDCYTKNLAEYCSAVCRNIDDMRLKLRDYASSDAKLVYIEESGKITAYVLCMCDNESMTAEEFCAPNNQCRDALLSTLAYLGKNRSHTIKLPPSLTNNLPHGFTFQTAPTGVMGAANISELMRIIAGFDDITVEVTDHSLPLNAAKYTFNGNAFSGDCDIIIDSGRLLQFLIGYYSMSELAESGLCQVNRPQITEKLDSLLPKTECYVVEEY